MATPIAILVRKRFWLVLIFQGIAGAVFIWLFVKLFLIGAGDIPVAFSWPFVFLVSLSVIVLFHAISIIFSFTLAIGWNLQFKLSFRLRQGMLIKYIFWLSGLFTVYSGILAYLYVLENKPRIWFLLIPFIADLLALITGMTVRYAIEDDAKKRKVCEFC